MVILFYCCVVRLFLLYQKYYLCKVVETYNNVIYKQISSTEFVLEFFDQFFFKWAQSHFKFLIIFSTLFLESNNIGLVVLHCVVFLFITLVEVSFKYLKSYLKFLPSKESSCFYFILQLAKDLLHPSPAEEKRKHKLKRLVQHPNSYFMDVKCPGNNLSCSKFSLQGRSYYGSNLLMVSHKLKSIIQVIKLISQQLFI